MTKWTERNEGTGAMERVLIYRLGSLGDTIVALPAFHLIRRRFPSAQILVLTNNPVQKKAPALAAVLENSGLIDGTIDYPVGLRDVRKLWKLREHLRSQRFSLSVDLTAPRSLGKSVRDYLFLRSCGIPRIIGTPWRAIDLKCTRLDSGLYEWETARLARRILPLGQVDLERDEFWDLRLTIEEQKEAANLLAFQRIPAQFIAFSIGTKADTKDWTQPNWINALRILGERHPNAGLVGVGAPVDAPRTQECLDLWKGPTANMCEKASVRVTAATLKLATLFLGHDSGPMHLAAAVRTRCVVVFSAEGLPGQWFPRGKNNTILRTQPSCFGCGLEVCHSYDKKCIRAIPVADFVAAVERHLSK